MKNLSIYASLPLLITALMVTGNVNAAFYMGGSYGYTKYEDLCDSVSGEAGATCDDEADGYKIFGGARISPNLAFEAAYMDMGDATASTSISNRTLGVTGLNFSALGIYPLSKSFELFGKIGLMFWEAETEVTGTVGGEESGTTSVNDSDLNFGFGGSFIVNKTFALRAEFERFHNISYESSAETPVSFLTLGVVVSF